ncbi:THAP domain-containing protein 2-like [Tachypleus tridentatus]|uniref:THAP domain-containing protein 2-like n=1 Tax=Tachypleus tridentatus TaxID=6853 RepID=UPI003FD24BC6
MARSVCLYSDTRVIHSQNCAMVYSCCAFNCSNRHGQVENVSYYRFPKDPDRRRRWIAAVNRKTWTPTKHTRLCSKHFVSGTKSDDPLSPDYAPSIFHFTRSLLKRMKAAELCKYENRKEVTKRRKEQQKRHEAAAGLLDLAFIESAGTAATDSSCTDSADELEATCDNFDFSTSQYTTET